MKQNKLVITLAPFLFFLIFSLRNNMKVFSTSLLNLYERCVYLSCANQHHQQKKVILSSEILFTQKMSTLNRLEKVSHSKNLPFMIIFSFAACSSEIFFFSMLKTKFILLNILTNSFFSSFA